MLLLLLLLGLCRSVLGYHHNPLARFAVGLQLHYMMFQAALPFAQQFCAVILPLVVERRMMHWAEVSTSAAVVSVG